MTAFTSEQILSLAPDASSASAGRDLANASKWKSLGKSDRALWGECQGSGSKPYQVRIDLTEPAFGCSCPSRKFPCKHTLGLFLLSVATAAALKESDPPAWVAEWLAKRDAKVVPKPEKAEGKATPEETAAAQQKRAAKRESRVASGIEDLDLWLKDLLRQGLAAVQTRPSKFWEEKAARLVDAQAPGLARMLRDAAVIPAGGQGWEGRLLESLGAIHLLMEGHRRLDALPDPLQAAVRTRIGWTIKQEDLLEQPGIRAVWQVVGQRVEEEDRITVQRTWLRERDGERHALILSFAAFGQTLDKSLVPGTEVEADLVYFPGACPLRAAVKERFGAASPMADTAGLPNLESLADFYSNAVAADPWVEHFPACLADVTPHHTSFGWIIVDSEGRSVPVSPTFRQDWTLLAISGGRPVTLFGEWDGRTLLPLSIFAESRFVPLTGGRR